MASRQLPIPHSQPTFHTLHFPFPPVAFSLVRTLSTLRTVSLTSPPLAANNDLGTACGKYFRVSCLSILDAGKFITHSQIRVVRIRPIRGMHTCTAEIRGGLSALKNPWGAVCNPTHRLSPLQVTPTSSVPSSKCDKQPDIKLLQISNIKSLELKSNISFTR